MATDTDTNYNQVSGNTIPTTANAAVALNDWGIDGVLSGDWIIQSEDLGVEPLIDQTQDQKGRVVSMIQYDVHYTLTLSIIGGKGTKKMPFDAGSLVTYTPSLSAAAGTTIEEGKIPTKWQLMTYAYNGSYNDKKKYTLNLEAWTKFPA